MCRVPLFLRNSVLELRNLMANYPMLHATSGKVDEKVLQSSQIGGQGGSGWMAWNGVRHQEQGYDSDHGGSRTRDKDLGCERGKQVLVARENQGSAGSDWLTRKFAVKT